jgi:hypothetical protein
MAGRNQTKAVDAGLNCAKLIATESIEKRNIWQDGFLDCDAEFRISRFLWPNQPATADQKTESGRSVRRCS